jgi:hypothetical protein
MKKEVLIKQLMIMKNPYTNHVQLLLIKEGPISLLLFTWIAVDTSALLILNFTW